MQASLYKLAERGRQIDRVRSSEEVISQIGAGSTQAVIDLRVHRPAASPKFSPKGCL